MSASISDLMPSEKAKVGKMLQRMMALEQELEQLRSRQDSEPEPVVSQDTIEVLDSLRQENESLRARHR